MQCVENRFWLCSLALTSHPSPPASSRASCWQHSEHRPPPNLSPARGGAADRTHRTWTPRDPAADHRTGSWVEWTGCTGPALLEETKPHVSAAPGQTPRGRGLRGALTAPGASRASPSRGGMGKRRGRGGNISRPAQTMRHSQNSWTDNPPVLLEASAAVISALMRSCGGHAAGSCSRKPAGARAHTLRPARPLLGLPAQKMREHSPLLGTKTVSFSACTSCLLPSEGGSATRFSLA